LIEHGLPVLLLAWALGSMVVLVASMLRIYRFDRLLRQTSSEAPAGIQWLARDVAWQIELRSVPTTHTAQVRLSPMTWWAGGPVRVVIPAALPDQISSEQLRWVLAHELAHVKRRDHLVRWLEWIACVAFWWNPVAWWARRHLRIDEEASCDALVPERLGPQPGSYAAALLAVVEHMWRPAVHPPAVATGIDGGGSLEQRFRMIVSGQPIRRLRKWLVAGVGAVVVASLVVMPAGVGGATGPDGSDVPRATASADMVGLQTVAFSQPELAFLSLDGRTRTTVGVGAVADGGEHALLSANTTKRSADLVPKQATKAAQAKKVKSARKKAAKKAARQADAAAASAVVPPGERGSDRVQGPLGRVLRS